MAEKTDEEYLAEVFRLPDGLEPTTLQGLKDTQAFLKTRGVEATLGEIYALEVECGPEAADGPDY